MKLPHIAAIVTSALVAMVGVGAWPYAPSFPGAPWAAVRAEDVPPDAANSSSSEAGKSAPAGKSAEESPSPLPFDPDLAIFTAIVFLALLAVLTKFAWKPIAAGLTKREQSIADQIDEARKAAEKANESLGQYQARIAAAEDEVRQLLAAARRDADAARDRIVAEAREAADKERVRAIDDIRAAKNAALNELAQRSVDAAIELAGRVVQRELKPADHAQLIRQAVEQFPSRN